MSYKELVDQYWPRQNALFEQLTSQELVQGCEDIVDAVKHQVLSGGKRLRAVLPLMTYFSFQHQESYPEEAALWAGLGAELLHNATLCHDDIMDGDQVRRGTPTVWVKFGMPQGINAGALLYSLADEALHHMPLEPEDALVALRSLEHHARNVIHGQAQELVLRRDRLLPNAQTYYQIIAGKTGSLFALCFKLGALTARVPQNEWENLLLLGFQLGELFQIQDDLLDLIGDKGRGESACDLWEGKPSWLITHCVENLSTEAQEELRRLLYIPRPEKKPEQVQAILDLFDQTQAVEEGLNLFRKLRKDLLARSSQDLQPLEHWIQEFVERISAPIAHALT